MDFYATQSFNSFRGPEFIRKIADLIEAMKRGGRERSRRGKEEGENAHTTAWWWRRQRPTESSAWDRGNGRQVYLYTARLIPAPSPSRRRAGIHDPLRTAVHCFLVHYINSRYITQPAHAPPAQPLHS